jgi:UDP-GlcNAc:undecaprenyl-phosphate/decaprenyl-phosphate GlcNAc-1-phosphate transferase
MVGLIAPALTLLIAAAVCAYLAPRLADAARRYGLVDAPDGDLKTQPEPVAYLGGLAVYLAFLTAIAVAWPGPAAVEGASSDLFVDPQVLAMLLAATLLMGVGLVDDLSRLTARDKFLGQVLAAAVLVKAGVAIHLVALPQAGQIALSVLWLLACANAINLLDVHDGLATTVAAVSALGFVALGVTMGDARMALLAAALAGACIGFLRVNAPPARQYLGDTGSLFIGGVLGMLALMGKYPDQSGLAPFVVPLACLAVPFIEVAQLVVTRIGLGQSPFRGSPHHLAHRLLRLNFSQKGVSIFGGASQFVIVAVAIFGLHLEGEAAGLLYTSLGAFFALAVGVVWRLPSTPANEDKTD